MPVSGNTKRILGIISLGFCLCLGLTLLILSCALKKNNENWYPMFELLFFFLSPIPVVIGAGLTGKSDSNVFFKQQNQNTFFLDFGLFLSTFIFVGGFFLPLIFLHSDIIPLMSFVLSVCGLIIMYASLAAALFLIVFKKKSPEMI